MKRKRPERKTQLKNNLDLIKQQISQTKKLNQKIKILAVSKNQPIEKINKAINCGLTMFGENKVQEAKKKFTPRPKNIELHLIGHLQKNKTKKAVEMFDVIQTVDSISLAEKINTQAKKQNKEQRIYCQINIGDDPNKHGVSANKTKSFIQEIKKQKNLILEGLMTILPQNQSKEETKNLYNKMHNIYMETKEQVPTCRELSMGMSNDFHIAAKCGSTIVRIGTKLFGRR